MKTNKNNAAQAAQSNNNEVMNAATTAPAYPVVMLSTDLIEPSDINARKSFDPEALREFSQNIAEIGIIQPVTVRQRGEGYELICGERRFRAARLLNLPEIPAIVRNLTDEEAADVSDCENLQREDLPPMEAAEALKRRLDTGRYDIASLAIRYGKSEKTIYQLLKLCDLIPGIADLVRSGKLSVASGIVVSKYETDIQEDAFTDRFGEDGRGEWCNISASALESRMKQCYTTDLDKYGFDKTDCLSCAHNSQNYDLFACSGTCGKCTNRECLQVKNTAHLIAIARSAAEADPKITFIGERYSRDNEATEAMKEQGHEIKAVETHSLQHFPTAPTAPDATKYTEPEALEQAQQTYTEQQQRYEERVQHLTEQEAQGKIRVYAKIGDNGLKHYYKEVHSKDTKTNAQLLEDMADRKKQNDRLAKEKIAVDVAELLRQNDLPATPFTPDEETMLYFFLFKSLRRTHYKAAGLKEDDYYRLSDEKLLLHVATLTEEQKTVIRRDYLYSHLTSGTTTVADTKGGMLLSFAKLHLPELTAHTEAAHNEAYGKKNERLDERIKALKEQEKKAKKEAAKAQKEAKATAEAPETAKTKSEPAKAAKPGKTAKTKTKAAAPAAA